MRVREVLKNENEHLITLSSMIIDELVDRLILEWSARRAAVCLAVSRYGLGHLAIGTSAIEQAATKLNS